jgi:hypothetical protein
LMGFCRIQEPMATEPLHIRRYEPEDKRAVRRLHDDALNEVGAHLDTTIQQRAARRLYLKNGYREVGRSRMGPLDRILYERGTVA